MWAPKNYRDTVEVQKVVFSKVTSDTVDAKTVSLLARAFVDLEMLKLRLRMKPAPKPIDVSVKKKSERPSITLE